MEAACGAESQDGHADFVVRAGWHPEALPVGLIVVDLGQPLRGRPAAVPSPGAFGAGYVKGPKSWGSQSYCIGGYR